MTGDEKETFISISHFTESAIAGSYFSINVFEQLCYPWNETENSPAGKGSQSSPDILASLSKEPCQSSRFSSS
jgi:hypothetical protein